MEEEGEAARKGLLTSGAPGGRLPDRAGRTVQAPPDLAARRFCSTASHVFRSDVCSKYSGTVWVVHCHWRSCLVRSC